VAAAHLRRSAGTREPILGPADPAKFGVPRTHHRDRFIEHFRVFGPPTQPLESF
jgi:hypothetical protein